VEVHGVTAPGKFAPIVITNNVTVLGKGKMPPARLLSLDKLAGGKQDSQWLALRGIVRSAVVEPSWGRSVLFLDLDIGAGSMVRVRVHDFTEAWHRLPGTTISIRGVCGTIFNDKRQFAIRDRVIPDFYADFRESQRIRLRHQLSSLWGLLLRSAGKP
jgi:hypothetical protein